MHGYNRHPNNDICVYVYTHHKYLYNKLYRNMHTSMKHPYTIRNNEGKEHGNGSIICITLYSSYTSLQ